MREKTAICKDCSTIVFKQNRCPTCNSPRILQHKELFSLMIAHVDCDAFYASVEKSHNTELINKPVIVGGGRRGIVAACCYIARINGIKSAMPIYVAKKLCPSAVIITPRMGLYREISRLIYSKMINLTPIVETVALDEAYLDLSGTQRLHGKAPVELLVKLARDIETELNLSISIGLSENRFLAKLASSLNKPRAFTVIGKKEKIDYISDLPITYIPGVGPSLSKKLKRDSIEKFHHLSELNPEILIKRYGLHGKRLWSLAQGEDSKPIKPNNIRKSISKEITFDFDVSEKADLARALWLLSEKVSEGLKAKGIVGKTITLKLKRFNFELTSVSHTTNQPIKMAEDLYQITYALLLKKMSLIPFRLMGLSVSKLAMAKEAGILDNSLDTTHLKKYKTESAMDEIKSKFGSHIIGKGRSF
tara:strand:+ start:436 stop:1695 length:1260 start_codon:yes stop_codon:yes gene_type:complete